MKALEINEAEIVYLPKNLNLEELVRRTPPFIGRHHKNQDKVLDRIAVVLGQLMARMIHNKDFEEFISLNSKVLESLVEDYRLILDWALSVGIIQTDGQYSPGKKSFGFRFSPTLRKETRKYFVHDPTLIKKLRARRLDPASITEQPFLYECLKELEIDRHGAVQEMYRLFHELDVVDTKLHSRIAAIDMIANKQFFFRRDKNVRRLHTNVTGLKREARKFLTWKGQELINVDIKNSQPYFSLALFREEAFHNLSLLNLLHQYNPSLSSTIMFPKFHDISGTYWKEYEEVVINGLYEYLANKLGIEREAAKELVFNIFFSVPTWKFEGKTEFIKLFPEVWSVFKWVNTGFYKTKKQGRKHWDQSNALAMLLQRIEATVMFGYIVPAIQTNLKGLPIWTIHDSILTIKGEHEAVAQIMRDNAAEVIGVPPVVKFEE